MGLLKKKEKNLTAETLHTALMLYHTEYMKEFITTDNVKSVKLELTKLKACGLGNTVNAKILNQMQGSDKPVELVDKIKSALPHALIVPYNDFFKVMKEYNLAVGKIDHYEKIIPEENIKQIYEATLAIKRSNLQNLNDFNYITELSIDSDLPKKIVKQVVSYVSRFPLTTGGYELVSVIPDLNETFIKMKTNPNRHINIKTTPLESEEWLIAAPIQDVTKNTIIRFFSSKEEERQRILQDPIVFKATKVGVVIVSMWGEEADSSIFDKYR